MIYWIWTWKRLGLPYWTRNNFICWNSPWKILELFCWIWIDLICLWYIGLEKHSALGLPHWTWIDFIKHWVWINQPSRDAVTKIWRLSWLNCFLLSNIVLIHAAFTAPSIDNLYMAIYPPTLLCFLCSSGYCISLSNYVSNTSRMFSHPLV